MANIHAKEQPMFCDLCLRSFTNKNRLRIHVQYHRARRFACNVCDYRTALVYDLKKHKIIHDLKEICKICDKPVSSLKIHLQRAHKPKKRCPVCEKMIAAKKIKRHLGIHDESRNKCKDCGETFTSLTALRK